jgi:hypothetical protein
MALYGLVDCAADPGLYPMVCRASARQSLFAGVIDPDLVGATPHIVRLDDGEEITRLLQGPDWARNLGIVCASDAPLGAVRRQLRYNLQARLPNAQVVLFRFYDPRVWVPYIENCDPGALPGWFGQITDYWAPHQGRTLRYRLHEGALMRQALQPTRAG